MTTRPQAEDLTLPGPARTLLSRTRGILDTYVTPRTPDRSGWIIGGGTILAARWRHRESRDIDLLVHPRTETRFLQPATAPELHRRLEAAGARKISFGRFSQILFAASKIEMLAAEPQPRIGHRRALVDGREATTLTSSQILTGKFANRSLNPPVRDLYDFAVAGSSAPRALMIAVNALAGNEIRWRLVSWEMEREKYAEEGPLELHGRTHGFPNLTVGSIEIRSRRFIGPSVARQASPAAPLAAQPTLSRSLHRSAAQTLGPVGLRGESPGERAARKRRVRSALYLPADSPAPSVRSSASVAGAASMLPRPRMTTASGVWPR